MKNVFFLFFIFVCIFSSILVADDGFLFFSEEMGEFLIKTNGKEEQTFFTLEKGKNVEIYCTKGEIHEKISPENVKKLKVNFLNLESKKVGKISFSFSEKGKFQWVKIKGKKVFSCAVHILKFKRFFYHVINISNFEQISCQKTKLSIFSPIYKIEFYLFRLKKGQKKIFLNGKKTKLILRKFSFKNKIGTEAKFFFKDGKFVKLILNNRIEKEFFLQFKKIKQDNFFGVKNKKSEWLIEITIPSGRGTFTVVFHSSKNPLQQG